MLTAYNPKIDGEWYEPQAQPDGEPRFRVRLRPLSGIQLAEVQAEQGLALAAWKPRAIRAAWRYGVAGSEGLDTAGIETAGVDLVDLIPDHVLLAEVAGEIMRRSRPGSDEKN